MAIAYDAATGTKKWVARYDGPAHRNDGAVAVAVSPDGARVYVSGSSTGVGTRWDLVTIAYDSATGAEVWVARYDGPKSGFDKLSGLAISPDGARLYVTGTSSDQQDLHARDVTIGYETAGGTRLWVSHSSVAHGACAIGVSPTGHASTSREAAPQRM